MPHHPSLPHPSRPNCSQGNAMVPLSWEEMRDPETQRTEKRKVAKVVMAAR